MSLARFRLLFSVFLATGVVLGACASEVPTSIGGSLVPEGSVRTYELLLDAAGFIEFDTTLTGYVRPVESNNLVVARQFGGTLTAHTLARFVGTPASISVRDAQNNTITDTLPRLISGQVILRLDTLRTRLTAPVQLQLHTVGEAWDPFSATWALRVDSGAVRLPWRTPGGTRGRLLTTAAAAPGVDSIIFDVDSATVKAWSDTLDLSRGALIASTTAGTRLHAASVGLRVQLRSSVRDTIVSTFAGNIATTFVFDPQPAPTANLRIGGTPAWRSFLRFRAGLDTIPLPCPNGVPGCVLRLRAGTINYAALQLRTLPAEGGFALEDTLIVDAYSVAASAEVPVGRSPLLARVGRSRSPVRPTEVVTGGTLLEVPVTGFFASLAAPVPDSITTVARTRNLALIGAPEGGTFGYATLAALGGASAPKLRIIVTVANEVQLP
jgi:hypothetical protein